MKSLLLKKAAEPLIKTVIVKKRGRKYFDCVIGNYAAKVVINDISKDIKDDTVVKMLVNDLSVRSKYGTSIVFEPIQILEDRDAALLRDQAIKRKEAEKWLVYAEGDVERGSTKSNAIENALRLCKDQPSLAQRLTVLQKKIEIERGKPESQYGRSFPASYGGKRCYDCNLPINTGDTIRYRYIDGGKSLVHENCKAIKEREEAKNLEAPYFLSEGSGYGCRGWSVGEVVHAPKYVIDRGGPDYITVVRSSKKYFSQDGMSFGVGDDSGYMYAANCREATEEEKVPLMRKESERATIIAAKRKLDLIEREIRKGEYAPKGTEVLGESFLKTFSVYGGGECIYIDEPNWIWLVDGNGADGDDWSQSNVQEGIGYRVPYTEELASEIRQLDTILSK